MIPPELEERVRQAWAAGIPDQYRLTGKDKGLLTDRHLSAAIIAPPPPTQYLVAFFASLGPMHLTADQRHAQAMRRKQGSGRKPDAARGVRIRLSRAKPKPSSPLPIALSDLDYI